MVYADVLSTKEVSHARRGCWLGGINGLNNSATLLRVMSISRRGTVESAEIVGLLVACNAKSEMDTGRVDPGVGSSQNFRQIWRVESGRVGSKYLKCIM